jgi:uncharacterized Zn-binding protein involved in type VI secretion
MGKPAAKLGDCITATDTHIVLVPNGFGVTPTPLPHLFNGVIDQSISPNVFINGSPAATVGSVAHNLPPHLPTPPGVMFQILPTNLGQVIVGSTNVFINAKPAARAGDVCLTCNDPAPMPVGVVAIATVTTVLIGG